MHALQQQLRAAHDYLLMAVTSKPLLRLVERPSLDLRPLLTGTEGPLRNLPRLSNRCPTLFLDAIPMLTLAPNVKSRITSILASASHRCQGLVYAMLVAGYSVVSWAQLRRTELALHPHDAILLTNFLQCSLALRAADAWTPLCMPMLNASGYLHAYVSMLATAAPPRDTPPRLKTKATPLLSPETSSASLTLGPGQASAHAEKHVRGRHPSVLAPTVTVASAGSTQRPSVPIVPHAAAVRGYTTEATATAATAVAAFTARARSGSRSGHPAVSMQPYRGRQRVTVTSPLSLAVLRNYSDGAEQPQGGSPSASGAPPSVAPILLQLASPPRPPSPARSAFTQGSDDTNGAQAEVSKRSTGSAPLPNGEAAHSEADSSSIGIAAERSSLTAISAAAIAAATATARNDGAGLDGSTIASASVDDLADASGTLVLPLEEPRALQHALHPDRKTSRSRDGSSSRLDAASAGGDTTSEQRERRRSSHTSQTMSSLASPGPGGGSSVALFGSTSTPRQDSGDTGVLLAREDSLVLSDSNASPSVHDSVRLERLSSNGQSIDACIAGDSARGGRTDATASGVRHDSAEAHGNAAVLTSRSRSNSTAASAPVSVSASVSSSSVAFAVTSRDPSQESSQPPEVAAAAAVSDTDGSFRAADAVPAATSEPHTREHGERNYTATITAANTPPPSRADEGDNGLQQHTARSTGDARTTVDLPQPSPPTAPRSHHIDDDPAAVFLVLVSTDTGAGAVEALVARKEALAQALHECGGILATVTALSTVGPVGTGDVYASSMDVPGLLHFVYVWKPWRQYSMSRLPVSIASSHEQRKALFRAYQHMYDRLTRPSPILRHAVSTFHLAAPGTTSAAAMSSSAVFGAPTPSGGSTAAFSGTSAASGSGEAGLLSTIAGIHTTYGLVLAAFDGTVAFPNITTHMEKLAKILRREHERLLLPSPGVL